MGSKIKKKNLLLWPLANDLWHHHERLVEILSTLRTVLLLKGKQLLFK